MLVGVDIGGTKTAVLVTNKAGRTLAQVQRPTDVSNLVDSVSGTIQAAIAATGRCAETVCAIGAGVPGMIDRDKGTVELATNLRIMKPLNIASQLSDIFSCPAALDNDVRLAALGAYQQLRLPNLAYLSIGTGVAAGLILDNQLWHGQHNMAGELGHVILDDAGTLLEEKIAGPAILAQAAASNLMVSRASTLFHVAASGDVAARRIVGEVSRAIVRAIQWLTMTYDVEKVVIGGGVTAARNVFLAPIFAEMARLRSMSMLNYKLLPDEKVGLLPKGFNAGLLGAIRLAQQTGGY